MTRAYSAGGSRRSAVLAATLGLHAGLFIVIASGLGPGIRRAVEQSGPVSVRLPEPVREPRHVPGKPVLDEARFAAVPEPELQIPEFPEAQQILGGREAAGAAPDTAAAGIPRSVEYVAASLRTRRDRVHALIDSCYPAGSRRDDEEGRAVARLVIGAQGSVLSWYVAESSGFPRLDGAMECVIRRLAFAAASRDGRAVASEVELPIVFRLD